MLTDASVVVPASTAIETPVLLNEVTGHTSIFYRPQGSQKGIQPMKPLFAQKKRDTPRERLLRRIRDQLTVVFEEPVSQCLLYCVAFLDDQEVVGGR